MTAMMNTWDRFHVWGRSKLCPFDAIASFVPKQGRILDVGCGHGLFSKYLKTDSRQRQIQGVDVDRDKIEFAKAHFTEEGLDFKVMDLVTEDLDVKADCVVIVDVLYLIPYERQKAILSRCHELLADNGVLVIKEIGDKPRWKAALNQIEETLAVKILKITEGHDFYFHTVEEFRDLLEQLSFSVDVRRVDRGYPHPHVAYICRKSKNSSAS